MAITQQEFEAVIQRFAASTAYTDAVQATALELVADVARMVGNYRWTERTESAMALELRVLDLLEGSCARLAGAAKKQCEAIGA